MTAVRQLQAGDAAAAAATLEPLLAAGEHPEVLHLAGVLRYELGDPERGEAFLTRAAALAPSNPEIPYNHGSALLKSGQAEPAAERFEACLRLAPRHVSALNNLASALRQLGRSAAAIERWRQVLAIDPNHAGARVNLGQSELEAGRIDLAVAEFERAVRADAGLSSAWAGLGEAWLAAGRLADALTALERSVELAPQASEGWRGLGRARTEAVDFEGALAAWERVVALEPESADAWNNLSSAWTSLGKLAPAEEALARALAIDPGHREALVNRAALLELSNRSEEALAIATSEATDPRLRLVRSRCLLREQQHEEARALLQVLVAEEDEWLRKDAWFTLGQLEDRARNPEEAWHAFVAGNRLAGELWYRNHPDPDPFVPGLARVRSAVADSRAWASKAVAGLRSPAFLFGFQRSGTTLIDTVLGVHDRVHVMEEQPVLNRVIGRMNERWGEYPAALPDLSPEALEDLRACYWREAARLAPIRDDALLLDKSPLHTVHLALIRRLFPEAPLVLALRHPLDVCLSCFMQDFTMSAFMTHFLSVGGVARVYRAVMDLWLVAEAQIGDAVHRIRYEDLVEAPERELRALADALGIAWDDRMLDHTGAARERGLINTPSYEQVTRPIYRSARYRWQRYRSFLRPVEQELAPYVAHFGYGGLAG